ncbi:hypothetical protein GCM10011316_23900 [Roseibium aquae]|uniref:Tail protein n=1 Tax=Roseibium aquae TaxID=1323746 RepID=A0A916TL27_9HYPH|nr:glycoside hydrolase/phage tail family protein [Roseibium aquae]GGB51042.1 hypothetical protein GCM10011316_23900 [Roseibium aquae]
MATLILSAAGQAFGSALGLGGFGGLLGKAAGALAGNALDQSLFGSSRTIETGRLSDLDVQSSSEGASLPKVYGRVRLAGQVIWATRFEEVVNEERRGGKGGGGGVTVRSYAYFANFAIALCEGPIARIGRIWADGKPVAAADWPMRIYKGTADQVPDPLISAFQTHAPAYRGTAYVVFERLPLEPFGNRLPQLSFEVIRPVGALERQVRAVTVIPGAGEFAYAPSPVSLAPRPGVTESVNVHVPGARSDWHVAMDELQDLCPNLERAALVVAWFGDDLRAGQCTLRPKVEVAEKETRGGTWSVAGLARDQALLVSQIGDRPAYGGTPSDGSVIAALKDLKARGIAPMLIPFILMDVPPGNGLPDPHGGAEQAAFPWRGRIVPAGDVGADALAFFGTATASDFQVTGETIVYTGPQEWSFRRHILHHAALAKAAGGVEAFLIGTEMRGLTRAHTGGGAYPCVQELVALSAEARALLGPGTKISYAADWSEYGSHVPASGELRFPLDPLWAAPEIDFIGIDNYLPMADQRDGGDPDGNEDPYDLEGLRSQIAGGEYFDFFYASAADRAAAVRTPITDGAAAKPWVYRVKDLKSWWSEPHVERVGNAELSGSTGWVPKSKPVRFTELGIPAIDRGANQPNVFVDPKSSESAVPYFSRGNRDDLMQRRALEAALSYWDDRHPWLPMGDNPVSPVYGGRMVDGSGIYLWTWDARPYPAFPAFAHVWADGQNWDLGHWLTGRLGQGQLDAVITALLADFGISPADVRVTGLSGSLDGLAVPGPVSARQVIEPLLQAYGGLACDRGTEFVLKDSGALPVATIGPERLAEPTGEGSLFSRVRAQTSELAREVRLSAEDPQTDFRRQVAASRRLEGGSFTVESMDLKAAIAPATLRQNAEKRLRRIWRESERLEFSLGPGDLGLEPGDTVAVTGTPFETFSPSLKLRIEAIEDTGRRRIEAVRVAEDSPFPQDPPGADPGTRFSSGLIGPPHAVVFDLPVLSERDSPTSARLAVFAAPWPGSFDLLRSSGATGYEPLLAIDSPIVMGRLLDTLESGPIGLFDRGNAVRVELFSGHLESRPSHQVFDGRNALAVRSRTGGFEILQFQTAELTGPRQYRLTGLLRGQRGTEPEAEAGSDAGAEAVHLDPTPPPQIPVTADQRGLEYAYKLVPQGLALDDPASLAFTHAASGRGALPFAPVHVRGRKQTDGILIRWVRQTRVGGDSWAGVEVALGEEAEAYEVDILAPDAVMVLRTIHAQVPQVLYPTASMMTDFGQVPDVLNVTVFQMSATAGRGLPRKVQIHV